MTNIPRDSLYLWWLTGVSILNGTWFMILGNRKVETQSVEMWGQRGETAMQFSHESTPAPWLGRLKSWGMWGWGLIVLREVMYVLVWFSSVSTQFFFSPVFKNPNTVAMLILLSDRTSFLNNCSVRIKCYISKLLQYSVDLLLCKIMQFLLRGSQRLTKQVNFVLNMD